MQADLFSARKLITLICIGTLALLGTAYLIIFGEPAGGLAAGPNAFSHSAIGHAAFVETLRRLDLPVHISRGHANYDQALLLLAEPADDDLGHQALKEMQQAPRVLVVLPKREGEPDPRHPSWLLTSDIIGSTAVNALLHDIDPQAHVVRTGGVLKLTTPSGGFDITLDDPQLISSTRLTPVISQPGGGILLGKLSIGHSLVWVLSDPDLIANLGLGRADNAAAAVNMIRDALPAGGKIVIDEVIHGFMQETNLLKSLLHLPLVIATGAFLLTVIVLILAGAFRFGGARQLTTALSAGKLTLISNAAALLVTGGRHAALADRYLQVVFGDIARQLGQSKTLTDTALVAWLDQEALRRGLAMTASGMLTAINGRKPSGTLLRQLEIWKREMTHGVSG